MRVLDVGGGLGGPARTFASVFGCTVEMLDITEEFCGAGTALTAQTGLSDLLSFRHGSALDMPYPGGSFDMVWTQHSSMNIADKARLYQEIHRVLRPGGRLALHEILTGLTSPIPFPVPWARAGDKLPELASNSVRPHQSFGPRRAGMGGRNSLSHSIVPATTPCIGVRRPTARPAPAARPRLRRDVPQPGAQPRRAQDLHPPGRLRTPLIILLSGTVPNKTPLRGLALLQALP